MPGDHEIIRQIYVDNGFPRNYYRFTHNLDATYDAAGNAVSFALPIQSSCNLTRISQLSHLQTLAFKKAWQSRRPIPDLGVLRDHPALEQVIFESTLMPEPKVLLGLNTNRIRGLTFRFVKFAAWLILAKFKALEDLELYLHNPIDWATICSLQSLRHLRVFYGGIRSLAGIEHCRRLETLAIMYNPDITSIGEISRLTALKALHLSGTGATDLSPLSALHQLNIFEWHECPSENYQPIEILSNLTEIDLYRAKVTDGAFLTSLKHLRVLNLEGTPLSDIHPLAELQTLQTLNLSWSSVHDLASLAGLPNLKTIELNGMTLDDLGFLGEIGTLEEVSLIDAKIEDISPLMNAPNLRRLHLRERQAPRVNEQLSKLQKTRPDLLIELYPLA